MQDFLDDEFGSVRGDEGEWILQQRVEFNGVALEVYIEPESADVQTLSPVQREAVRLALNLAPNVLAVSAPAVVQNYEVYREMIGDEELPPLSSPEEVWQQVSPTTIQIPAHGSVATPTFLLFAECDWDPEHGLVVRFRNGYADASDQQGELGVEN